MCCVASTILNSVFGILMVFRFPLLYVWCIAEGVVCLVDLSKSRKHEILSCCSHRLSIVLFSWTKCAKLVGEDLDTYLPMKTQYFWKSVPKRYCNAILSRLESPQPSYDFSYTWGWVSSRVVMYTNCLAILINRRKNEGISKTLSLSLIPVLKLIPKGGKASPIYQG